MADSNATRSRRYRQHRQGDHSLCRHDRPVLVPAAGPAETGPDFDPATGLRDLARQLSDAYAADPGNAALARELRMTLLAIEPGAEPEWDPVRQLQRAELESRRRGDDDLGDMFRELGRT